MVTDSEYKLADQLAYATAKHWKGIDRDDVKQQLYLWLISNQKYLDAWRQDEKGEGKLVRSLTRESNRFCANEQKHRVGKSLDDDNYFDIEMIQRGLPYIWEITEITALAATNTNSIGISLLSDLNNAYYSIKKPDQKILALKYRDGLKHAEIGKQYNISEEAARKRVDRALQHMLYKLNGEPLEWVPPKKENEKLRTVLELGYEN